MSPQFIDRPKCKLSTIMKNANRNMYFMNWQTPRNWPPSFFFLIYFFLCLFFFNFFHHEGVGHTTEWGSKLSVYLTEALWEWSVLFKNTEHCPGQVLKPGPLDPKSSALINLNHCASSSWFLSNFAFCIYLTIVYNIYTMYMRIKWVTKVCPRSILS